jgi:hypothetical protein
MVMKIHGPELMAEAEKLVKPHYPTAVQVENIGTSSKGLARSAEDMDQWKFIFTDIDGTETVTLDYSQRGFGRVERVPRPWIKTQIKELPRNMPLEQALSYLKNAGFAEPFLSVTLRAPFPQEKGALYIFQMEGKAVYMDALSGEIVRAVND